MGLNYSQIRFWRLPRMTISLPLTFLPQTHHFPKYTMYFGTLDAVMTTGGDQKFLVEYKLVKQSDKWKILSIKIQDNGNP
jgi:hypothetical protein